MPNEMQMNPDYQLVMSFLQKIRPGDMDEESAQQLMIIGQRIQAGGVLSDQEREMFQSVVGATDRFPVEQMDTFPQGTNPDIMRQPAKGMGQVTQREGMGPAQSELMDIIQRKESGQMTELEEKRALETLSRIKGNAGMTELEFEDMKRRILEPMAPVPMPQAPSSAMTVPMPTTQGGAMNMQEMIDAGIIVPKRPMTRPTAPMTSMRPQTRR